MLTIPGENAELRRLRSEQAQLTQRLVNMQCSSRVGEYVDPYRYLHTEGELKEVQRKIDAERARLGLPTSWKGL